jgi:AraC-like DNA-binding protein
MLETQDPAVDASLRAGENLPQWNTIVGEAFSGCVVDTSKDQFNGELWRCKINDLNLVRVRAEASRVERWITGRPCTSSGSVLLHLQSEGRSISGQRGRSTAVGPGEAAICDPDYNYSVDFPTPYEMFVVELPIAGLLAREPGFDLERSAAKKVDVNRSQLLLAFLRTAWQQRDCLSDDADWRDCVSRTSLDLAMRAISRAEFNGVVGASAELRRAVIDHIRHHLADTELRTSSIARALKISSRSVQTVFERLATTTSGFILEQRLARAAEYLIRKPGGTSITELAYDCGFSDSAYFSRCFKRHFGVTPRNYRRDGPA